MCYLTITIHDVIDRPTWFTFDLVPDSSPLILGQDDREHCNTINFADQKYIQMRRPHDDTHPYLFTYIVPSDQRLRLKIAPHPCSTKRALLGNIHTSARRDPLVFCELVHRYTHPTTYEMKALCKEANMLNEDLEDAIERV